MNIKMKLSTNKLFAFLDLFIRVGDLPVECFWRKSCDWFTIQGIARQ